MNQTDGCKQSDGALPSLQSEKGVKVALSHTKHGLLIIGFFFQSLPLSFSLCIYTFFKHLNKYAQTQRKKNYLVLLKTKLTKRFFF